MCGTFLGKEDEWNIPNKNMTFVSKEELLNYFTDFEIIYFDEKKFIKSTLECENKHWHVFELLAKKR